MFQNKIKLPMKSMRLSTLSPLISLMAISLLSSTESALAQKIYDLKERKAEEIRIRKDIENKLDWRNRPRLQLDETPDADRMLIGGVNESILLRQGTGERFGLFEAFNDADKTKVIELRLHKKNKITGRFQVYSAEYCDRGASVKAAEVTSKFVLYITNCISRKFGEENTPFLFDYMSRNLYMLEPPQSYDANENNGPEIKLENGIYKMRWSVKLKGEKQNTLYVRNFKISKDEKDKFTIHELSPVDAQIAKIQTLEKLPSKPEYDLPSFVADW